MKKDIRMIGLDLDGTLLMEHATLAPRTRLAIEKAIAAGIVVLPATGRPLGGIPAAVLEIPGIRYALTSNGAKVHDLVSGEEIYRDCFDVEASLSLLDEVRQYDCLLSIYLNDKGYDEMPPDDLKNRLDPWVLEYVRTTRTHVKDLAALMRENGGGVEKFAMLFFDEAEVARAQKALLPRRDISLSAALALDLELNTPTANKGAGLLALAKHLGIKQSQIMAVGDSLNDMEMLKKAGYGVAMGNAAPLVKNCADHVTLPCKDFGAALVIEAVTP